MRSFLAGCRLVSRWGGRRAALLGARGRAAVGAGAVLSASAYCASRPVAECHATAVPGAAAWRRRLRPQDSKDESYLLRFDPEGGRSGACVIILPGGNYEKVCMDKEGEHVASWLNSLGITAYVLRYRCIPEGHRWPAQWEDFRLAMQMVHADVRSWSSAGPEKIGVLGFSAGGHLAAFAATAEDADGLDAQILVYPCIDTTKPDHWPWDPAKGFPPPSDSAHLRVTSKTCPAFLAVSSEDGVCTAEDNTEPYRRRLQAHGVPAVHLVKPMGKHGHGLRGGWPKVCELWLEERGWTNYCNKHPN